MRPDGLDDLFDGVSLAVDVEGWGGGGGVGKADDDAGDVVGAKAVFLSVLILS